ncbi:hypothetical protein ACJX0J_032497, partial [Zea mays]
AHKCQHFFERNNFFIISYFESMWIYYLEKVSFEGKRQAYLRSHNLGITYELELDSVKYMILQICVIVHQLKAMDEHLETFWSSNGGSITKDCHAIQQMMHMATHYLTITKDKQAMRHTAKSKQDTTFFEGGVESMQIGIGIIQISYKNTLENEVVL